jgi:phosphoribosylaminoimidazolecarboxamide formyltransferase/IMP cyclohydrolase
MPRALLSVYDKTGIVPFARSLLALGWELVSSGGTATALRAGGVPCTDVAELTGMPAILGHRVVTLHPAIHGAILADRSDPSHLAELDALGIEPISLVVVNLYPFASDPSVELIDVGGPAMVRAAAKNHAHVAVVVDPTDFPIVLAELADDGAVGAATRLRLARKAFATTAAYDAAVVSWLDRRLGEGPLPPTVQVSAELAAVLRYGENPHQAGARYRLTGRRGWWDDAVQHGGKELSYLNVYDTEAAWQLAHRLSATAGLPAAVVVKHANPCGAAIGTDLVTAYRRAHDADPVSAFGGIVALTERVGREVAEALAPVFTEVVVAPGYDDDALAVLTARKNLRVLSAPLPSPVALDVRPIDGGLLVQEADRVPVDRSAWRVAGAVVPSAAEWRDLELAWQVVAAVSSNAIVLLRDGQAVGIGAGQQNRLDSARIAATKADGRAVGGVCASDAFFPFRDGVDAVAAAGVRAVIEPGGSVRDDEVVAAADEHGIAIVFTGERHFRH